MRYHKAVEVTKPEADFIIARGSTAGSDILVVSRGDTYYDVRSMSSSEVDAFVADLARAEHADVEALTALPC